MNFLLKILRPFAFIARKLKYINRIDPFFLLKKMNKKEKKNKQISIVNKKNILIFSFRISPESNSFELMLGKSLIYRGYKPIIFLCQQEVDQCDNFTVQTNKIKRCTICLSEQKMAINTFGFEYVTINKLVNINERNKIKKLSQEIKIDEIYNYKYKGVSIINSLNGAMQRYFLVSEPDYYKNENVFRDFLYTIFLVIEALDKYCKKYKPEFMISSHGVYSTWGAAADYCKYNNIRFITWGRGYRGANLLLSHNDSYLMEPIYENKSNWVDYEFNDEKKKEIIKYIFAKAKGSKNEFDYVNYYNINSKKYNKEFLLKKLNINKYKITFGLFPNIPWDGQVFNKSEGFPNMRSWIFSTIDWFLKNPQNCLIIRIHPAELKSEEKTEETFLCIVKSRYKNLPKNIIIIQPDDEISSYDIAKVINFGLVYGTSFGLELVFRKIPIIMTGNVFYSNKGIAFEAKNKIEYFALLEKAAKQELILTSEMYENCLKYSYHYFFRRHLPDEIHNLNGLLIRNYNINSFLDLMPGKFKYFDMILDDIIKYKPFIINSELSNDY